MLWTTYDCRGLHRERAERLEQRRSNSIQTYREHTHTLSLSNRWLNLLCFIVHTIMVLVTLHLGQWRWEEERGSDRSFMEIRIFRIVGNWTSADANGYDFVLKDNGMPINICWLTASFFGISAAFHLWALVVGIFSATWNWYWQYALWLSNLSAYACPTSVSNRQCAWRTRSQAPRQRIRVLEVV